MSIERICSRNIISVPRSCSLEQAAVLMRKHHVGALLVTEDEPSANRAVGVVTDRDFVLHAMAEGIGPREANVGTVMTRGLATVPSAADIPEVMEAMRASGVRRLAVTGEGGTLVGIVSLDDIIDALGTDLASLAGIVRSEREREVAEPGRSSLLIV